MYLSVRSGQRTSGGAEPGSPAGMKGNSGLESQPSLDIVLAS